MIECAQAYGLENEKEALKNFKERVEHIEQGWVVGRGLEQGTATQFAFFSAKKFTDQINFLGRAGMALFSGLALIVPMLIMTLHPTQLMWQLRYFWLSG
jgi:hypothetical protein